MLIRTKFSVTNIALAFALAVTCSTAYAQRGSVSKSFQPKEGHEVVDLFQAMEDGQIDVKLIPKDVRAANVFVTNKSDKPLAVKMPAVSFV